MENKYKNRIITIPNILSFFRLLLIPVIIWLYIVKEDPAWTTAILALSGVTDVVDGIIARKCRMVSDFGKVLDPVADKLTQIAMLVCLVSRFQWMVLPLSLLVVKEFTAGVLGLLVIRKTGAAYSAAWHGKITTVLLYSMMLIHLLWYGIPTTVSGVLIGVCVALIILSAVLYGIQNIKTLTNKATGAV